MKNVPFDKLIYLMLAFKMTNEEINIDLEKNRQLFRLSEELLNGYREAFTEQLTKKEKDWYNSAKKVEFKDMPEFFVSGAMNALGVELPYRRRPLFREALYLFSDPDLRTIMQAYIIMRKSTKQIADTLTKFSKYETSEEVVNMYSLMFCNMADMDFSSWKEYLLSMPRTCSREASVIRDSFVKPQEYVQWRLGLDVDFATELDLIKDVMTTSFVQFKEAAVSNNPTVKATATQWSDRFIIAADRYAKHKNPNESDMQTEFKVYLQKLAPNVKHISEVDRKQLVEAPQTSNLDPTIDLMKEQDALEERKQIQEYLEGSGLS